MRLTRRDRLTLPEADPSLARLNILGEAIRIMWDHILNNPWVRWWTDSVSPMHQATFPRLLLALILGACVGAERQWRQRAAGLRTNTLVCFGAAAFVDLGLTISPGTTQVVAYVVSGVGFLGAGAIMKDGANVRGLNTAATLWCSAAVGACAGSGEMLDAVFVTALLITINSVLRPLSRFIDRRSLAVIDTHALYRVRLSCDSDGESEAEHRITHAIAARARTSRDSRGKVRRWSNVDHPGDPGVRNPGCKNHGRPGLRITHRTVDESSRVD